MIQQATPRISSRISVTLPEGWLWCDSLQLVSPDGDAQIRATTEPLPDNVGLADFVQQRGDLLRRDCPGFEEHRLEPVVLRGGVPGSLREYSWNPEEGQRVRQLQVHAQVGARVVTATATDSSDATRLARLLDTLLSLDVTRDDD